MGSYVEENHDGLAFTHHTARRNVYCPLLKRETLVAKTATTSLHDNLVAIEDRGKKISLYISNNGYDVLQTEIRREYLTKILIFAQIVVGKITIVVDMTIGVKVIETDLNIQFAVEYRFHSMKGYREYTITSTEPESLEMRKNRPDEKVRSQEFLMRMCPAEEARQNNTA